MAPGRVLDGEVAVAAAATAGAERLLTRPLVAFLVFVAAVLGWNLWRCHASVPLATAVRELADGDPDAEERERLLRGILAAAPSANDAASKWAVLLAAIALEDAPAHAAALARLQGSDGRLEVPPPDARRWLHLGDAMLGNVLAAGVAEAAGDRSEARARWELVEAQSRLAARAFLASLARAARQRLAG
jgi:hypothetical protein